MARENEEIDEGTPKSAGTVMVGGMDHLVPGGKEKPDDLEVEVEDKKPAPVRTERRVAEPNDDDREEDARLAYDTGEDDELEERGMSRRQRRNRSRKTVVQGRDQEIAGLYQRVDQLTNMIGQMGQSQVGLTIHNIDTQLGAAQQALAMADTEMKRASAEGNLARYDELRGLKEEAQGRVWQLGQAKQRVQYEMQQGGRARPVPPNGGGAPAAPTNVNLNRRAQDFTETFLSRFPDFDPNGTDENTLVMKALDDSVAAEGYRPDTPMYWRTLEQKLAARGIYPDDNDDDDDDRPPRRAERRPDPAPRRTGGRPPTSGSSNNRRGTGSTFKLDPMMRDYLEGEGILHLDGLDDSQKAKRSRLINDWREGQRKAARGEYGR
jgi:hypothetical protein